MAKPQQSLALSWGSTKLRRGCFSNWTLKLHDATLQPPEEHLWSVALDLSFFFLFGDYYPKMHSCGGQLPSHSSHVGYILSIAPL